jgi:hypothetical protein
VIRDAMLKLYTDVLVALPECRENQFEAVEIGGAR